MIKRGGEGGSNQCIIQLNDHRWIREINTQRYTFGISSFLVLILRMQRVSLESQLCYSMNLCKYICPLAFYHHAKNQKVLMTSFGENVQKKPSQTLNLPYSPDLDFFSKFPLSHFRYLIDPQLHAKIQKNLMSGLRDI